MFKHIANPRGTLVGALTAAAVVALAGAWTSPVASARPGDTPTKIRVMSQTTVGSDTVTFERHDDSYTIKLNDQVVKSGSFGTDDWEEYEVKNASGAVVATVSRDGDGVSINTGDADTLDRTITITSADPRGPFGRAVARGLVAPRALGAMFGGSPPKVMLGVNLGTPDESLAQQLGVKPEDTTIIQTISEGLPAAKGGLERYDVIVKVDGKTPAGEDVIRKMLREKNPGDVVAFEVIRKGERKTFNVTLEPFDGQRLSSPGSWSIATPGERSWAFGLGADDERLKEQAEELRALARSMEEKAREAAGKSGAAEQEALSQLQAQMRSMVEDMARRAEEIARAGSLGTTVPGYIIGGGQGGRRGTFLHVPTPPSAPSAPEVGAGSDERIDRLDARLKRIEELLARLTEEKASSAGAGAAKKP